MSYIKGHEALGNTSRFERKGPREHAKHSSLKIIVGIATFTGLGLVSG
jgi:hypothetical protein